MFDTGASDRRPMPPDVNTTASDDCTAATWFDPTAADQYTTLPDSDTGPSDQHPVASYRVPVLIFLYAFFFAG